MLHRNALAIDVCDRTRVTTTPHPSFGLALFTGIHRIGKGIGTAITRLGSGTTFSAIAERGDCRVGEPLAGASIPQAAEGQGGTPLRPQETVPRTAGRPPAKAGKCPL